MRYKRAGTVQPMAASMQRGVVAVIDELTLQAEGCTSWSSHH